MKKKIWRYHFVHSVRGHTYVDTSHGPSVLALRGSETLIYVNVPLHSPAPPVYVPWTNIKFVEQIEIDDE